LYLGGVSLIAMRRAAIKVKAVKSFESEGKKPFSLADIYAEDEELQRRLKSSQKSALRRSVSGDSFDRQSRDESSSSSHKLANANLEELYAEDESLQRKLLERSIGRRASSAVLSRSSQRTEREPKRGMISQERRESESNPPKRTPSFKAAILGVRASHQLEAAGRRPMGLEELYAEDDELQERLHQRYASSRETSRNLEEGNSTLGGHWEDKVKEKAKQPPAGSAEVPSAPSPLSGETVLPVPTARGRPVSTPNPPSMEEDQDDSPYGMAMSNRVQVKKLLETILDQGERERGEAATGTQTPAQAQRQTQRQEQEQSQRKSSLLCRLHGVECEYYDEDRKRIVCSRCLLQGESRNCQYKLLEDIGNTEKELRREWHIKMDSSIKLGKSRIEEYAGLGRKASTLANEAIASVREHCNRLRAEMDRKEKDLIEEVREKELSILDFLEHAISSQESACAPLEALITQQQGDGGGTMPGDMLEQWMGKCAAFTSHMSGELTSEEESWQALVRTCAKEPAIDLQVWHQEIEGVRCDGLLEQIRDLQMQCRGLTADLKSSLSHHSLLMSSSLGPLSAIKAPRLGMVDGGSHKEKATGKMQTPLPLPLEVTIGCAEPTTIDTAAAESIRASIAGKLQPEHMTLEQCRWISGSSSLVLSANLSAAMQRQMEVAVRDIFVPLEDLLQQNEAVSLRLNGQGSLVFEGPQLSLFCERKV
jgi:hypothetical protein